MSGPQPNLSAHDVGRCLLMALEEEERITREDARELSLVHAAGVAASAYFEERFVLHSSAFAIAIQSLVADPPTAREVWAGYLQQWATYARSSLTGASRYELFRRRLPTYADASARDDGTPERSAEEFRIAELDVAFGDSLVEIAPKSEQAESACRMLALALTQAYWQAGFVSARQVFRQFNVQTH